MRIMIFHLFMVVDTKNSSNKVNISAMHDIYVKLDSITVFVNCYI